jgi:acetoin utilization deacetylase AcuC-like enzyme
LRFFYTDTFIFPLPEKHTFPAAKYRLLRERIIAEKIVAPQELMIPPPATDADILRVHDANYLQRLDNGELTQKEIRRVGLPWSPEIVLRAKYSAGGTIAACHSALSEGISVNLGGGTHHAFADHGQGYCWLNDAAIASRALQADKLVKRVLVIDCDVHQGNGTAAILKEDPGIFTFSIHGKNNFPYRKQKSDLDIALEDQADDATYLDALEYGIRRSLSAIEAELVIYLAGADPYQDDRFGRLALSKAGLAQRDQMVLSFCGQARLPLAVTLGGGYSRRISDTVDIHMQTVVAAVEFAKSPGYNTAG